MLIIKNIFHILQDCMYASEVFSFPKLRPSFHQKTDGKQKN